MVNKCACITVGRVALSWLELYWVQCLSSSSKEKKILSKRVGLSCRSLKLERGQCRRVWLLWLSTGGTIETLMLHLNLHHSHLKSKKNCLPETKMQNSLDS